LRHHRRLLLGKACDKAVVQPCLLGVSEKGSLKTKDLTLDHKVRTHCSGHSFTKIATLT
jgi:hypothetical protein